MKISTTALMAGTALLCCPTTAAAQNALLQTPSRSYRTGDQVLADAYRPEDTACADMDGDGDLDLVIAHAGNIVSPKVSVMFNLGNGSFGMPMTYAAPGQTMEVALADYDGDGDVDAAFAQSNNGSAGNRVLLYENSGNGALLPYVSYTVGTGPTGLISVDVDLDGDQDLVTANNFWLQEDLTVLYNDGFGNFPTRVDVALTGHEPVKVAAGDLNGDGFPELVASLEAGDPAFAVLTNDGAGGFGTPAYHSTGFAAFWDADVAVEDVDNDGDRDVLYGISKNGSNGYTLAFALYRNDGTGTLAALEEVPVGQNFGIVYDFAVDDVTGDGWPDVLGTVRTSTEGFVLVASDGAGGFLPPISYRAGEYSRSIELADVGGDGDLDAIVTNSASLTITIHENDGTGFGTPPVFPVGQYIDESRAADIDLDGDVDLVSGDFDGFLVFRNQGDGSFLLETQASVGSKPYLKLADVNGDGYPDAVFGALARALNDGTGTFGPTVTVPGLGAFGDVETLDIDADGDLDAVATGSTLTSAGFYAWENDGAGNFGPVTLFDTPQYVLHGRMVTGDFNGDAREDVVTGAWQDVFLWLADGAGGFTAPTKHGLGAGGAALMYGADLDGDGNQDVVGSHWGTSDEGETLTILFGNGDGTFAAPLTYFGMFSQWTGGIGGLTGADVDGDGDLDIVGGAAGANDVAVFLNNGDRTFAPEQRYGVNGRVDWIEAGDFDGDGRDDVAASLTGPTPAESGIAVIGSASSSPFSDLGFAMRGDPGTPVLVASGRSEASQPFAFEVGGGCASSPFALVISLSRDDAPLLGGTLVPALDFFLLRVTDPFGGFRINGTWPANLEAGTTLYMQAWIHDPLSPSGASATNGLEVVQID